MILDEILKQKRIEVDAAKRRVSLAELTVRCADASSPRGFVSALRKPHGRVGLIAEIKQASPSAGVIVHGFDPIRIATQYERAGADCLSVLTDGKFFQGSLADMHAARDATSLPVLRKDFVIDEYQVHEARAAGADCILLIVAALTLSQLVDFQSCAQDFGMDVLVETHTAEEMHTALEAEATFIGINSRNLKTFVTDLAIVDQLASMVPPGTTLVAESSIKTRADVDRVAAAGGHAILVGETLMRSGDIDASVRELVGSATLQASGADT